MIKDVGIRVQAMMDAFKYQTEWEENHMVGVHVRRGDLTIYGKNVGPCTQFY